FVRQSAGTGVEGDETVDVPQRRETHVPAGRRSRDDDRVVPGKRLPYRLRRGDRTRCASALTLCWSSKRGIARTDADFSPWHASVLAGYNARGNVASGWDAGSSMAT